jgi:uncharacterized cofD-like protein
MSDSGGSSGRLRMETGVLPPGDIMRAIIALSEYDTELLKKIFYRIRFENCDKLTGHNLGNLFLACAYKNTKDFMSGVKALSQAVGAVGRALPVTLNDTQLVAQLTDGSLVKGEDKIDRPDYDRSKKIEKVWLEPNGNIFEESRLAIEEADYIILGPGSLYTSIVATLVPSGVSEAIERSNAKLIYVSGSIFEKKGESGPEVLSGFVKQLQSYLPRKIDVVIFNEHTLDEEEKTKYLNKNWGVVKNDQENISDYEIIIYDYETGGSLDFQKLGAKLKEIIL